MSSVVLFRDNDGKLVGLDDRGKRQHAKFKRTVAEMPIGASLRFEYRLPRSPKHHAMFFVKVHYLFEQQEEFYAEDDLRAWLLVGAAYCTLLPGADGGLVAVPQSINWETLEEVDFLEVHRRVDAFLWETRARRMLWPRETDEQTYERIEQFRREFDR